MTIWRPSGDTLSYPQVTRGFNPTLMIKISASGGGGGGAAAAERDDRKFCLGFWYLFIFFPLILSESSNLWIIMTFAWSSFTHTFTVAHMQWWVSYF